MKEFLILTIGFTPPTPEIMEAWGRWFQTIQERIVQQIGLGTGREIREDAVQDLPRDREALTGFLIIRAASLEEAVQIARSCPAITSTRVYEVHTPAGDRPAS